jgi:hypothetical protein
LKYVQVRIVLAAIALKVLRVGNVIGCAHEIPATATRSTTGDRQNERWILNSHIDLATWNDVYNL